jgi:hypothetical protein
MRTARLGLNAQECLDFYFASGETVLPGAYGKISAGRAS